MSRHTVLLDGTALAGRAPAGRLRPIAEVESARVV